MSLAWHRKKNVLLMSANQSSIDEDVYEALASPVLSSCDPDVFYLRQRIVEQLRVCFGTQRGVTFALVGTGTTGMETCLVNLVEPDDCILVLINGSFGYRISESAIRMGAQVDTLAFPWGQPILPEKVKPLLERKHYSAVVVVHAESSTGASSPLSALGRMVDDAGALFLVDCVTSLGGMPVEMDNWHADALYSVASRCLSCPSGLALFAFSEKAQRVIYERKKKVPSLYRDVRKFLESWDNPAMACYHAPPVNLLYALHKTLENLLNEGLQNVYARHRIVQEQVIMGVSEWGFIPFVEPAWRLPMLTTVSIPQHIDASLLRKQLLCEHGICVSRGIGVYEARQWRIGHMGHSARSHNVARFLEAIASSYSACSV